MFARALAGRDEKMPIPATHHVLGTPISGPFMPEIEVIQFGMGCFRGAERKFGPDRRAQLRLDTALGLRQTPPIRKSAPVSPVIMKWCSSPTTQKRPQSKRPPGVLESHDPTQGMRQGNDIGTTRSGIYTYSDAQEPWPRHRKLHSKRT